MTVRRYEFAPADTLVSDLMALGVEEGIARRWGRLGGAQVGTLRRLGNTFAWEVHRRLSRQLVLVGVDGTGPGVIAALIADMIEQARHDGLPLVKAQVDRNEPGRQVLEMALQQAGFTSLQAPLSGASLRQESSVTGWVLMLVPLPAKPPPYLRQRTDFTCGPASLLMGRPELGSDFQTELKLWRESTYIVGASPHGLALAAAHRGILVDVLVSTEEPILVGPASGALADAIVTAAIHSAQVADAIGAGIRTQIGPVKPTDFIRHVAGGGRVLVLIDEADLNGESCAHWVLAWGVLDGGMKEPDVLIHDPWTDADFGETWVESHTMAISSDALWEIAKWGKEEERALVLL